MGRGDAGGPPPLEREQGRAFWAVGLISLCTVGLGTGRVATITVGEDAGAGRRRNSWQSPGACRGLARPHRCLLWALRSHQAAVPFTRCSLCKEHPSHPSSAAPPRVGDVVLCCRVGVGGLVLLLGCTVHHCLQARKVVMPAALVQTAPPTPRLWVSGARMLAPCVVGGQVC